MEHENHHEVIDALMLAERLHPVGFSLKGGPFGEIRVKKALYRYGYEDLKLEDFCDGWIYTKPISAYEGVTLFLIGLTRATWRLPGSSVPIPMYAALPPRSSTRR